ncbi:MAG: phosphatidate cytidylyltransferase [Bacteroidia bacterium]
MDKNLIQRLITGSIFVTVLVGGIIWNQWSYGILFLFIITAGLLEFYRLSEKAGATPQKILGLTAGIAFFAGTFGIYATSKNLLILIVLSFLLLFVSFITELYRQSKHPFQNIAFTVLGILYVAVPFSLWNFTLFELPEPPLGEWRYKGNILLGFFIILWTSDSLQYVCGRLFGRHKLFERISPKKTWEGFIGGALFTMLAAWFAGQYFTELRPVQWMIIAGIVAVAGTLGDLVESMFKRSIDIKDSGNILPGHGGILDRFDAVLISSPFVISYILLSR